MKYKGKYSVRLYINRKSTGKNSFILTLTQHHPWKAWPVLKNLPLFTSAFSCKV